MKKKLAIGDLAPEFSLPTDAGESLKFTSPQPQISVLFFYPKDFTPGCTKEACAISASLEDFRSEGVVCYGISRDTVEKHQKFKNAYHLKMTLLTDTKGAVSKAYGAAMLFGFVTRRSTFVIGQNLEVLDVCYDVNPELEAERLKRVIRGLRKQESAIR